MDSCMLHAKSLPHKLWDEALNCANYIQNRSPHRSIKDQTPFEAWSDTKPEVTTSVFSAPVHGPGSPLKRGKLFIRRALSASLLDTLMRTSSEFIEPPLVLTATELSPSWHCHLLQSSDTPSYAEAIGHPSWESAMEEEYKSLLENQTWDLVPLPSGRKLVRCKWVYRTKSVVDGQITRRKARLVAKGFQQVHGIDYDETFAPVAKMDSIRLM
eukprot:PITA_04938